VFGRRERLIFWGVGFALTLALLGAVTLYQVLGQRALHGANGASVEAELREQISDEI
jgi:hypothetical protein